MATVGSLTHLKAVCGESSGPVRFTNPEALQVGRKRETHRQKHCITTQQQGLFSWVSHTQEASEKLCLFSVKWLLIIWDYVHCINFSELVWCQFGGRGLRMVGFPLQVRLLCVFGSGLVVPLVTSARRSAPGPPEGDALFFFSSHHRGMPLCSSL